MRFVQDLRPGWSSYALLVMVYGLALLTVGSALGDHFGFPLDDSWIHQSVGRNFASSGSLGYLPHQQTSGSTSLLWTLLVASNYAFAPHVSPVIYCLAINTVCLLAAALLLFRIALDDGMTVPVALLLAAAPALDGNYVWLAFTGMEHLLFVALSLASIWFWLGGPQWRSKPGPDESTGYSWTCAAAAGLSMGLLSMTRPEGAILPVLLLVGSLFLPHVRARSQAQIGATVLLAAILACIPLSVNLYTSHSVLPVTFKGRQWLYVNGDIGWLTARWQLLEQWLSRPFKAVMAFDGMAVGWQGRLVMTAVFGVLLALAGLALRGMIRDRYRLLLVVCAWGMVHAVLYIFMLPASGHGGRYQPLFLFLLFPLLVLGLRALFPRDRLAGIAVPGIAVLAIGVFSLSLWQRALADGIDHISHTHGVIEQWLDDHLHGQTVAVFDIGRIGYVRGASGEPNLIDLGGLTDPAYIAYLYGRRVPDYLGRHGVRYLVLPTNFAGESGIADDLGLKNNPAVQTRRLFRACSGSPEWQLAWSLTRNAFQCQEVDGVAFIPR